MPTSRALRLAHLTDIHLQPELDAPEKFARTIRQAQELPDPPELMVFGGDFVMDSMAQNEARVRLQWDLVQEVFASELTAPSVMCLGNHDVWGLEPENCGVRGDEIRLGKRWAMEELSMEAAYRSFDLAGWHFVVLDSTFALEFGYTARLDDAQFEWLAADLSAAPKHVPVVVISHIPILGASPFLDGPNEQSGEWRVPGAWMHLDVRRLLDLFLDHGNVRVCLSGHIHLLDFVEYLGINFLCDGAVCGAWWKGAFQHCPPGFAVVDLFEDGTFARDYYEVAEAGPRLISRIPRTERPGEFSLEGLG